jgi:SAM-dependent methyltransferase
LGESVSIEDITRRIAEDTGGFTGGPREQFGKVGWHAFKSLRANGLKKASHVLDLGCGALRLGYWLVRFLDADRYFGIEPEPIYLEAGLRHAIGAELAAEKRPRFDHNKGFNFAVFGVKFDFVVARSVFSHTSPEMMRRAMESFRDTANEGAVMLASYKRVQKGDADVEIVEARGKRVEWAWRRYGPGYVHAMAHACGLVAEDWGKEFNGQVWLRLTCR